MLEQFLAEQGTTAPLEVVIRTLRDLDVETLLLARWAHEHGRCRATATTADLSPTPGTGVARHFAEALVLSI